MISQFPATGIPTDALRFEQFFDSHRTRLFRIALGLLRDHNDANDVVQTVFLKAWDRPESFRGGSLDAWLATVCKNAARDLVRRRKGHLGLDNLVNVNSADDVETSAIALWNAAWLERAIADLPDCELELLQAAYWGNSTHAAIARSRGIPLGTVKTRIRTALRRLRYHADSLEVLAS